MKLLRTLCVVAALGVAGTEAAEAGPMSFEPATSLTTAAAPAAQVEQVRLVCGPFRCVRRFGWRYGYRPFGWRYGYGYRRFGFRGGYGFRGGFRRF